MLIALLIIIVLIVVWLVSAYNGFVKDDNNVEEAFSTMDVYLKKRYDLIPNLVETVKGYAKHESETLMAVVAARNAVAAAASRSEKMESEAALSKSLGSINVVAEQYPELKANTQYMELMSQLQQVENDIANSRKYYNGCVKKFNVRLQSFPSSFIGSMFRYEKKDLWVIDSDEQRENVKVEF